MTALGKRLRSDLFYVEWDIKPQLHQSFCHTCHCVNMDCFKQRLTNTHTHTLNGPLCPGLPGWVGTRRVKPIWILLKQETMSVSGVSWAICKSAPCFRQITAPTNTPPLSFLQAGHPSCRPANSVKALNAKTNFGAVERSLFLVELARPQSTFSFCALSAQYTANSSGTRRHLLVAFYSVDQLRPLLFQVIFKNLKRLN